MHVCIICGEKQCCYLDCAQSGPVSNIKLRNIHVLRSKDIVKF